MAEGELVKPRRTFALAAVFVASSLVAATAGAANAATGTTSAPAAGDIAVYAPGRYIVTFEDEPVASYEGYEPGFPATRPRPGRKIDPDSPAVRRWQRHLTAKHDRALQRVGATKIYDYTIASNGVAAELTGRQAAVLAKTAGVLGLAKDQRGQPTTTVSPQFLGLGAPGGIWSQLGGAKTAGAGTVVGVIDTGIWPESKAFAGGTGIPVPPDWRGKCVGGERFSTKTCNDKLVGARYYVEGFGRKFIAAEEYLSPRDGDGHGTHTASTAAGNSAVAVAIEGKTIDSGVGSGMAPGAKVAAYKVCWTGRPQFGGGCFNSDSVAAINDAVSDGVDVLNFSIGSSSESSVLDPVAQAFRGASNAGVYVANSAGNSGPGASTFDHPAPWVTTVAAATFRRAFQAVELGDGARYLGASTTPPLPASSSLVTSVTVKKAGAPERDAALCVPGTLDPVKAAGKVVYCDRGVIDRISKSFEVQRAGGVAMVMGNTSANSLNGDYHPIPSVHVSHLDRAAILAYIGEAGVDATARIVPLTAAELSAAPQVPEIAAFSSRGPSTTTDGDILKPDIAAPGVDVVAAVAPPFSFGREWDFLSGTSMSSPHIAGIGALVKARHPDWLPSEIKSALMTSATDTVSSAADPFAQGAGFVNPNGAADPGLVYPTSPNEYRQYLVGLGVLFAPPFDGLAPVGASNLNQASISVGKLAGIETVTRRVKNVSSTATTYTATAAVPGFEVVVTPNQLTLEPGAEQVFTVRFSRTEAPLDEWAVGSLTWSDGTRAVRSPIALQPVAVSAPTDLRAPFAASGSAAYDVTPGYSGTLDTTLHGLVGVIPEEGAVTTGPFDIDAPVPDTDTHQYTVTVSAGTVAARFDLDALDDSADLDLFVYRDGNLVDLSASGAADEQITLRSPEEGTYAVYVNGFATPGGSTTYRLANFVVEAADLPNSHVTSPVPVTTGTPVTLTASWDGLESTRRWLGVISYSGASTVTFLSVG